MMLESRLIRIQMMTQLNKKWLCLINLSKQTHTQNTHTNTHIHTHTNRNTWGQFHQHFTCSFYTILSQKWQNILTNWLNFYAYGEIASRCQFHQHFTRRLCADILAPKNFKPKTQLCYFCAKILAQNERIHMLVKSPPRLTHSEIIK